MLRHAAGLLEPTRGRVQRGGRVALLLQNPGDYLIHERVAEEAPAPALADVGLREMADRNPRDLSGGERQRLALAIVAGGGEPPAVLALDEPTRGMDREAKRALAHEVKRRAGAGQAVIVATHDPEFAAACADRAVLLADGRVIADAPTSELLAGGWYFATETARVLGGAGGALLPEQGALLLASRRRGPAAGAVTPAESASGTPVLAPGQTVARESGTPLQPGETIAPGVSP
jgi:energy-coupling factor transport system ATP-binding protein